MSDGGKIEHWWLVRHAPVRLKSIYGQLDVEADFTNSGAFERLAKALPENTYALSSDLSRCTQTAQEIFNRQKINSRKLETCVAFREQHFGDWQGLTFDEAKDADPTMYGHFWKDPAMHVPPNGESFDELTKRVIKARAEISSRNVGENILVVAHAGTIRAFLAEALGISSEKALLFSVDPLSLTKITLYQDKSLESWQISWINRTY